MTFLYHFSMLSLLRIKYIWREWSFDLIFTYKLFFEIIYVIPFSSNTGKNGVVVMFLVCFIINCMRMADIFSWKTKSALSQPTYIHTRTAMAYVLRFNKYYGVSETIIFPHIPCVARVDKHNKRSFKTTVLRKSVLISVLSVPVHCVASSRKFEMYRS